MAVEVREPASRPDDDLDERFQPDESQTRPRQFHRRDWWVLLGCAGSSFALMYLVFYRLAPLSGVVGFVLAWYAAFLVVYRLVVGELEGARVGRDRVMAVVVVTSGALILTPLALLIGYVVVKGLPGLTWSFLTKDQTFGGPLDPYNAGGAAHAIVGTLEQVALAVVISVPLGILCAIYLNEIRGPLRRPVRIFVDAMSGVPTIIAGLFIYSTWLIALGHSFSGFAAAMAISISMLPVITRTAEEVLRLVPDGLREASLALGTTEHRTVTGVVLPTARAGLITAVILGVARAVGETAPLIMTSFGSAVMNWNPFEGPQSSLPIYIFRNYSLGEGVPLQRAWTAALVLIVLVLVLFTLARLLGGWDRGNGRRMKAAQTLDIIEPPD